VTNAMTMEDLTSAQGQTVYSSDGQKIGKVEEIFHDTETDQPEWIGLGTGFLGTKRVLVPCQGAEMRDDGVYVPYNKDKVSQAPDIDGEEISQETESELYSFYGIQYGENRSDSGLPEGTSTQQSTTSGDAITRSEEELSVGTRQREAGNVRVRKFVETEKQQQTVPTKREEVTVERVPVTEGTTATGNLGEDEISVPIVEEEVVVEKRPVVKEELRVKKDTVTEEETVEADIRKEQIDVDESETTVR
jgi:uncharacterized protein (TIGR02271 family)